MNKDILTYNFLINGKVQGVGFRYWLYKEAINLNLRGYVKNDNDNKNLVIIMIQGSDKSIAKIKEKLKQGPKFSKVDKVKLSIIQKNIIYKNFCIK